MRAPLFRGIVLAETLARKRPSFRNPPAYEKVPTIGQSAETGRYQKRSFERVGAANARRGNIYTGHGRYLGGKNAIIICGMSVLVKMASLASSKVGAIAIILRI